MEWIFFKVDKYFLKKSPITAKTYKHILTNCLF